jgi:hypothetical protein
VWFPLHDFGNVSHATEEFALTHEPGALRLTSAREWADLDAAVTGTQLSDHARQVKVCGLDENAWHGGVSGVHRTAPNRQ